MVRDGLAESVGDAQFLLSEGGRELADATLQMRRNQEDQAYGQFAVDLIAAGNNFNGDLVKPAMAALRTAVVSFFKSRGLGLSNTLFNSATLSGGDLPQLFRSLSESASQFDTDSAATFVETARKFLVEPTLAQKQYLAGVSQGYFLYHYVGLDPKGTAVRREIFEAAGWIFDSSVILPLIAAECSEHAFARDLLDKSIHFGARIFTTDNLVTEAWEHLSWAIHNVANLPPFGKCLARSEPLH